MSIQLETKIACHETLAGLICDTTAVLLDMLGVSHLPAIQIIGPMSSPDGYIGTPLGKEDLERTVLAPGLNIIMAAGETALVSITVNNFSDEAFGDEAGVWATYDINPLRSSGSAVLMIGVAIACARFMKIPILDEGGLLRSGRVVSAVEALDRLRLDPGMRTFEAATREVSERIGLSFPAEH